MDRVGWLPQSDDHAGGGNFDIERRRDLDGSARLILRGELDLGTLGDLREALLAEQRSSTGVVVVLDQLEYLDSAGIGELVESCERARRGGRHFAVTPGTGNVRRVLWISGVLDHLCGATERPAEREGPELAVDWTGTDSSGRRTGRLITPAAPRRAPAVGGDAGVGSAG
jgi:anti-anti-sigma factor